MIKRFLLHAAILSLVVYYGLPYFINGISVTGWVPAIIAGITFAIISIAIKPILKIITLPLNLLSFGLFGLLLNIFLFWLVTELISGFDVISLISVFWGAFVITIINSVLGKIIR